MIDTLVEKIAKKVWNDHVGGDEVPMCAESALLKAGIREAISLAREGQWIPVSERLPEDPMISVLFYVPTNDEKLDTRWLTGWWHQPSNCWMSGNDEYTPQEVTHWAVLPSPPTDERTREGIGK